MVSGETDGDEKKDFIKTQQGRNRGKRAGSYDEWKKRRSRGDRVSHETTS
jgi:hypothetical protein